VASLAQLESRLYALLRELAGARAASHCLCPPVGEPRFVQLLATPSHSATLKRQPIWGNMIQAQVVNVGDGACTLIRDGEHGDVSIIDCGTRRTRGNKAADTASRALGASLAQLKTIVVTHFDADHWMGLQKLAPHYLSAAHPPLAARTIDFLYPGMPKGLDLLPPTMLAMLATVRGTGVRAMDLRSAWDRESIPITSTTVYRGETFQASGLQWTALWPPKHLPASTTQSVQKALGDLKRLADDMAGDMSRPHTTCGSHRRSKPLGISRVTRQTAARA
jgi:glyoxylase-like metal-dependent hydrolase (beta-lactamase superfamily II)